MTPSWPLHEARNKLSLVVHQAASEGPQVITLRGRPAAVVVSARDYERLTRPTISLLEFFQQSPFYGLELELDRSNDVGRDIAL
jgi:prevent-host-death family protein